MALSHVLRLACIVTRRDQVNRFVFDGCLLGQQVSRLVQELHAEKVFTAFGCLPFGAAGINRQIARLLLCLRLFAFFWHLTCLVLLLCYYFYYNLRHFLMLIISLYH